MSLPNEKIISIDQYGFQKILDDFENTKNINILTYNISIRNNELLSSLKRLENKAIVIITNIPQRWENYFSDQSKEKAFEKIEDYLVRLDPQNFKSDVEIYFNFKNHAKIYSTDNYTYIGSQNFSDESKFNHEAGIIIEDNFGEDIIEELKEISVRFFGVEIEVLKKELQKDTKKIEQIIKQMIYEFADEVDYEIDSGINYLGKIKHNFLKLTSLLEKDIKELLDEMNTKISIVKEKSYLENVLFIENLLSELKGIDELIDNILWEISCRGDFSEVYFNYEQEAMENIAWADEEHLDRALTNEMKNMEDICSNIKEKYEYQISSYFEDLQSRCNYILAINETIEEMTSNRDKINNAI